VVRTPSEYETRSGFVYMNQEDLNSEFVQVGDLIYRCLPHMDIFRKTISMNWIQRKSIDSIRVSVHPWTPLGNIDIPDMSIDVDWIVRDPTTDLPSIEGPFKTHFKGHVLSPDQQVLLYIGDNVSLCKVKMKTRGRITHATRVNVHVPGQTY